MSKFISLVRKFGWRFALFGIPIKILKDKDIIRGVYGCPNIFLVKEQ